MGLASNIEVKTIDDKAILDAPSQLLNADVETQRHGDGNGRRLCRQAQRLAQPDHPAIPPEGPAVQGRAQRRSRSDAGEFPAGSLIVAAPGTQGARVRKEIESLGLVATAMATAPTGETVEVDLPRIAIYTTWANTEKVGWVRLAFDRWEVPFDLIHKDHVKSGANLRGKYDVIVVPHQTQGGKALVFEQPKLSKPLPYKKNDKFKSLGIYAETRRCARRHGHRGRRGVRKVRQRRRAAR